MNGDRLLQEVQLQRRRVVHPPTTSTATLRDRRAAETAAQQRRRTDSRGGQSAVFYDDHDDSADVDAATAAMATLLERFRQPAAAAPQPPDVTTPCGGDGSLRHHHHHHHQYHHHRHRHHHHNQQHQRGAAAAKYNSVSAGSALSKSMRYADGWLYERDAGGTVGHGDGGRNRARSTFLGREHFGTATAAAAVAAVAAAAAATAAAANAEDPYDRVRKSRMAAAANVDRKRNRSGSPRTPSPDYDEIGGGTSSRRSILECDVNPYDLLRQMSDDDTDGDGDGDDGGGGVRGGRPRRMSLKDKFMNRIQDTVFAKNRTGFGSFSSNGSGKKAAVADRNSGGGAGGVNIAGHTVRLFDGSKSPTDRQKNGVTSSVWYDDGSASDAAAATTTTTTTTTAATVTVVTAQDQSPVRPPRRRCKQNSSAGTASVQAKRSHSLTAGTTPVFAEIKSILKKPASLTTDDLSPVRARTPPARPPSASTAGPTCNGSQKKTKKQVQFDIVSTANEKPTPDGGGGGDGDLSPDAEDFVKRIENAPPPPPPPPLPPSLPPSLSAASVTLPAAGLPTISPHRQPQQRPDNRQRNSIGGSAAAVDDETIVRAAVERKLKRSLSDRQNTCGTTAAAAAAAGRRSDGDVTVFNDTMRIHVRHKSRPDSRAAFDRPAEPPPPPPPPPPPSTTTTTTTTSAVTELFLRDSTGGGDAAGENRTVVQVSPAVGPGGGGGGAAAEPEQKTSILINSSPVLKTSVIIGEGGAAYAASSDNKVTISIGPGNNKCAAAGNGNYRSNVTVQATDRTGSRMSEFIRMNFDPVQAARLDVTPHVCGRGAAAAPLVSPYRVSEIGRRAVLQQQSSDTESSSAESCYASAKEDASYSSSFSSSSSSSSSSTAAAAPRHHHHDDGGGGGGLLHHCYDAEPIYEEISETPTPPPLPSCPPPDHHAHHGETAIPSRSIFEGATKYDIINYLVDAKRRCGGAMHDAAAAAATAGRCRPKFVVVSDEQTASESEANGACNDSGSEEYGCGAMRAPPLQTASAAAAAAAADDDDATKKATVDIERNDSGVGSETSQSSRSKWQQQQQQQQHQLETQHGCEDCDQPVEIQTTDGGIMFAPLVCRKCHKRRAERREIIAEIVETEEKYGRDLDIITEEFYRPMMVAGLLNADQLASVFLNVAELKEHSAALSLKLRDAYEIAVEQGDDDLLTVNIGRLFLEASPAMLHAFQSYCTRQGNAAMLLANLEKEKELLRIFLRVSQMENAVLRRMNLNSFLMVPVQRVTKYPLLLARLYKVTPEHHLEARQTLNEARHKIQLHLEHINSLAKDISSTKLWRKIYAINGKRPDSEDLADIKFRKVAVDVLEWSGLGEEIRFAMEGRLLYTQPSDHNWRRGGRTIKLMPINAIIVTLGKPNDNYNPDADDIAFPKQNGIRDASLVLLKEKGGRISLLREPMYLDRCVVCCESDWDDYFELHEITTKDTYILKGQDGEQTKMWYRQLQYHCQTLGCWRKRRNALANIMINRNCT